MSAKEKEIQEISNKSVSFMNWPKEKKAFTAVLEPEK